MELLENLFEDGILKIKFGILKILEILKNGILKIKLKLLEFWKILRMVVLENYSKNEISEN